MIPEQRKNYQKIPKILSLENYHYMAHARRKQLSHEITASLEGIQRRLYILFNFFVVSADRLVDYQIRPPEFLLSLRDLMKKVWQDEIVRSKDDYEEIALEFAEILKNLKKGGLRQAEYIYIDLTLHFSHDYRNARRRTQVLSEKELEEINKGAIEAALAAWFQLTCFTLPREKTWQLVKAYGLPIMVADDLVDIDEDLSLGFINVSQENLNKLDIVDKTKLNKNYALKKLRKIEKKFSEGDQILMSILKELPKKEQNRLCLLRDLLYSWIEDAKKTFMPT